jgi:hypothetical protein
MAMVNANTMLARFAERWPPTKIAQTDCSAAYGSLLWRVPGRGTLGEPCSGPVPADG